jgi:hypothetical protein
MHDRCPRKERQLPTAVSVHYAESRIAGRRQMEASKQPYIIIAALH